MSLSFLFMVFDYKTFYVFLMVKFLYIYFPDNKDICLYVERLLCGTKKYGKVIESHCVGYTSMHIS